MKKMKKYIHIQIFLMKDYYCAKCNQDLRHRFYRVYMENYLLTMS